MNYFFRPLLLISLFAILSCNSKKSTKLKVNDDGVNIAYTDTGNGDTTLLFVHGWCINKSYWSNQAAYFGSKYRVVAIDLAGFGESGKNRKDWSTRAFSNDVDATIKQLNLKNVILIGHSMAGDIVLQTAIDNPESVIGLVGVDNFKNFSHPVTAQSKKDFADAIIMLKHHFKAIAFDYFNQELFSKTTGSLVKKRVLNDVANADTTIAAASMEQGNNFDEVEKLPAVKRKLYIINSDVHSTDTSGFITNKIPFRLLTIHGTGHFPMIEDSKDFNLLLEQVLEDIKGSKK